MKVDESRGRSRYTVVGFLSRHSERLTNRKRRRREFLIRWTLQTPNLHRDGNGNRTFWVLFFFFLFKSVFAPTMACVISLLFRLQGYGPKITILALKSKIVRQRKMSLRFCWVRSRVFKRPAAPTVNNRLLSGAERLDTEIRDSLYSSGCGDPLLQQRKTT